MFIILALSVIIAASSIFKAACVQYPKTLSTNHHGLQSEAKKNGGGEVNLARWPPNGTKSTRVIVGDVIWKMSVFLSILKRFCYHQYLSNITQ